MPEQGNLTSVSALSPEFLASLRKVYSDATERGSGTDLKAEMEHLERILPSIAAKIAPNYTFDSVIDRGGAGVVIKVIDANLTSLLQAQNKKVYRALKVARPMEIRGTLLNTLIARELKTLASLTHSNVIKLYFASSIQDDQLSRPFYIMDFIEDRATSTEYLRRSSTTTLDFIRILNEVVTGIAFLFSRNVSHNDIKPSNILVSAGRAIISDLGSAVDLLNQEEEATITFTRDYAHPEKLIQAVRTTDPNRLRRTLPTKAIKIVWDLYSLGCTILELLDNLASTHPDGIPAYEYRYIRLLGSRLLDAHTPPEQFRAYDFPRAFLEETKYTDINDVLTDIAKLTGEYKLERELPELDFFSGESIQVAMHGQTPTSEKLLKVIAHPAFKRLSSVSQLGLIAYVYPGATHSRAEHSLGTYGNAARLTHALWNDPINPIFRQIMGADDLRACLLAALLHDVGQYPLAHDLEEADPKFFDHQEIGYRFMKEPIEKHDPIGLVLDGLWKAVPPKKGLSERVTDILKANVELFTLPIRDRILHSVVNGPIDADKLDYLARDSRKLNVPYGLAVDFERLSKVLTVVHTPKNESMWAAIGVHEKGKVSAESVAFARYCMYGAVYWHRTSRSVKAMLHHAVWDMLSRPRERLTPLAEELNRLSEELKSILRQDFEDVSESTRKALREEFINVILKNRLPAAQQELFKETSNEGMKQALWPGINISDLQLLAWLWQKCRARGKRLIEAVAVRTLFKRVLVVSKEKNKEIWSKAHNFASKASASDLLNLGSRMQEEIILHLQRLPSEDKKATTSFDDQSLSEVYSTAESYPLVLVDIPSERTAGMQTLFFFGETDRWRYHSDELVRIRVEESNVWSSIVEAFGESIGKIRIFVHPKVAEVVRSLGPTKLESCLYNSVTRAQ